MMANEKVWDLHFLEADNTPRMTYTNEGWRIQYHIFASKAAAEEYAKGWVPRSVILHRAWSEDFLKGAGVVDHRVKS
jgi:hypothetical protein